MPESHPAAKSSLSFAKLVATPTDTAWSQAYNAGNLFACLSLTINEANEEVSLHVLGKEIFSVFQSEFFTLEEKNTDSIKESIQKSLEKLPPEVVVCLTLAYFKEESLIVCIAGSGKAMMKRGEKVGTVLAKQDPHRTATAASGYLKNGDTLILETGPFASGIPQETIVNSLELALPNDVVEALSPQMHEQDNGAQAAIVITYGGASQSVQEEEPSENATLASLYDQPISESEEESVTSTKGRFSVPHPPIPEIKLTHRRKLFLNIALVILLLLGASILLTMKKNSDDKQMAVFTSIYPSAEQYYEEGKGLESLNASLSQDSYRKAEKLLLDGKTKISKGTAEYEQIEELLAKVNDSLQSGSSGKSAEAKEVEPEKHSLLAVEKQTSSGRGFGQDADNVYVVTDKAITSYAKSDGDSKTVITNKKTWSDPQTVVPYQQNFYVLDQQKGVLKFVPSADGYGSSSYFSGTAPDLSDATGMAIDKSVWLLFNEGTIKKYTSGVSDGLTVSGLEKPLKNPTKIVTDSTMESVYVLDQGNSRIVQFDKKGAYQNAYSASVISKAKDFVVLEKEKKILLLSGDNVWEINL